MGYWLIGEGVRDENNFEDKLFVSKIMQHNNHVLLIRHDTQNINRDFMDYKKHKNNYTLYIIKR